MRSAEGCPKENGLFCYLLSGSQGEFVKIVLQGDKPWPPTILSDQRLASPWNSPSLFPPSPPPRSLSDQQGARCQGVAMALGLLCFRGQDQQAVSPSHVFYHSHLCPLFRCRLGGRVWPWQDGSVIEMITPGGLACLSSIVRLPRHSQEER